MIAKIIMWFKSLFTKSVHRPTTFTHIDNRTDWSIVEHEISQLINKYRISQNLEPLQTDKFVQTLAQSRVEHCVQEGHVTHEQYGKIVYLAQNKGLETASEILAEQYYNAESVVKGWIKSSSHNKTILKNWTYIGVSAAVDNDKKFYCVVFAR